VHHRVNPYPGACRQNETEIFSDHDETSPSIAVGSLFHARGAATEKVLSQFMFSTESGNRSFYYLSGHSNLECTTSWHSTVPGYLYLYKRLL